jgi:hypothetical protein
MKLKSEAEAIEVTVPCRMFCCGICWLFLISRAFRLTTALSRAGAAHHSSGYGSRLSFRASWAWTATTTSGARIRRMWKCSCVSLKAQDLNRCGETHRAHRPPRSNAYACDSVRCP